MFTFGFFSTHLPYIAFVLFYGYFFFVGIEKASAGELGEGQQIVPQVVSATVYNMPDADEKVKTECSYFSCEPGFEQLLLYEKKKNLCFYNKTFLNKIEYWYSWFSRPPPVA